MEPWFLGEARVMVPGGRKRRDSASVGTQVPGARTPGDGGPGELAAGGASGHNRRQRPGPERREQPRRAEPPLAGIGRGGRWLPREGGTGCGKLGAGGPRLANVSPAARRSLFPPRRGTGPPLPGQDAGEMMSPGRTQNPIGGVLSRGLLPPRVSVRSSFLFSVDGSFSFQG